MKTINLYASELATLIGINPYQKVADSLIKLWQTYNEEDFEKSIEEIEKKCEIKFKTKEKEGVKEIMKLSEDNKIDISKVKECLDSKDTADLLKKRQELFKEINEKGEMADAEKKNIMRKIENATNKNFGTVNEKSVIENYAEMSGKKVKTGSKYVKKKLCSYKDVEWYLGGKIDGITEDDIIVEIKNRIYKLFRVVRDYEKPQVQAYMYILSKMRTHLVESIRKNGQSEINIIEEEFDEKYWDEHILRRINNFIKIYNLFLEDINLKTLVLLGDEDEVQEILLKFLNI